MSLFVWGSNKYGELGSKQNRQHANQWAPLNITLPDEQVPMMVSAGEGHSIFLTDIGLVYTCGRGYDGQLGHKEFRRQGYCDQPKLVEDLQNETICYVAAGATASYAVTTTGRLYQWGLVHQDENQNAHVEEHSAARGQLTGMAQDQEGTSVNVDQEARAAYGHGRLNTNRMLGDIVKDSTEKWMLANDDADAQYFKELEAMGYQKEQADEIMQERGREYHGMLRVQIKRCIQPSPRLVSSLTGIKVVSISAGFGHTIALSDTGRMYGAGYNDRGQLGLGHRISTNVFKPVDYMAGKFVVQVACGQQHTICRAIDRRQSSDVRVGNHYIGCSVYVCGNGILGQLGLGLLGTTKGKLFPTLLPFPDDAALLGAIDVSCGENFSVAVMSDGSVYSWGHSEYNQHGKGAVGGSDYVDHFYYFSPRKLRVIAGESEVRMSRVSCGSNFTIGITEQGDAYSWGWNAFGVLGQGQGYLPTVPSKVVGIGKDQVDSSLVSLSAGANHVLAIAATSSNQWAKTFGQLLNDESSSDAIIVDEATSKEYFCHRVLLSARSRYLSGYLKVASREYAKLTDKIRIIIDCQHANSNTISYLLDYIYTDRLTAPKNYRHSLAYLAEFLNIDQLAHLCWQHVAYSERKKSYLLADSTVKSTFERDLRSLLFSETFADLKFTLFTEVGFQEILAHKVILSKIPYFHCMLSGQFKETGHIEDGYIVIDLNRSLTEDCVSADIFMLVLEFIYCGNASVIEDVDSFTIMSILVMSNKIGLYQLAQLCEKTLATHLHDFPENVDNCYEFAQSFNIARLIRQCEEILNLRSKSNSHEEFKS